MIEPYPSNFLKTELERTKSTQRHYSNDKNEGPVVDKYNTIGVEDRGLGQKCAKISHSQAEIHLGFL